MYFVHTDGRTDGVYSWIEFLGNVIAPWGHCINDCLNHHYEDKKPTVRRTPHF